ncbi:MAG TPA: ATP-binding protein [Nitrospira sp.]|nr:ATP-binding protein [Nitrospira sp.]
MATRLSPAVTTPPPPLARGRFISLRAKFLLFFSLILIVTSSTLSWYFIQTRRASMTAELQELGSILLTSLVSNGQFRYGALIAEDRATLRQFVESLMAVDEVVYVVIRGADHMILAQQNKLVKESSGSLTFSQERRFYPDEHIADALYGTRITAPRLTLVRLSPDKVLVPADHAGSVGWTSLFESNLYDVALPVLRKPATDPSQSPLPYQFDEASPRVSRPDGSTHLGVIQIGLSDAAIMHTVVGMVRNVVILTAFLIGAGILGAHVLTQRITTPLRSLADVARQLTEGRSPPPLRPSSNDEVGQLTRTFNLMAYALHERNVAINTNMDTIRRQISQLTTVHQTSAAIARTLDLHELLDTVLQLLMTNLKFSRMVLMLRHEDGEVAYVAQVAGVPEDIAEAARYLTIPIREDDSITAELLIHAKPVLVGDIAAVAHRMHPETFQLATRIGVTSFVCVPLQSHNETLGFLGGDRGAHPCSTEDLDILLTIAGHVASAIDNARTYAHLAQLTQHLEYRIEERTRELSVANERLKDHDQRRSVFFSVASHELRTPMTAIRSFADNMLDGVAGPLTERQTTYLTRIGHNLNRLTRIINQLLDWSRIDLKRETLNLEPVCVRQIAGFVAESLRTVAVDKQIALDVTGSDDLPAVAGDRDKMEQIFWNLIGNAVKFTPAGGRVIVEAALNTEGQVQVCVADTGCGIEAEHLDKIFNEFSKVPSPIPNSQGAQLGLFITKNLVALHHGTIRVESDVTAGTRFYVAFPAAAGNERTCEH